MRKVQPAHGGVGRAMLEARGTGRRGIRFVERPEPIRDARPGSTVPLFVPNGTSGLKVVQLVGDSRSTASPTLYSAPLLSPPSNNSGAAVAVCGPRPSPTALPSPGARLLRVKAP